MQLRIGNFIQFVFGMGSWINRSGIRSKDQKG